MLTTASRQRNFEITTGQLRFWVLNRSDKRLRIPSAKVLTSFWHRDPPDARPVAAMLRAP
jgi:hypothetical protein